MPSWLCAATSARSFSLNAVPEFTLLGVFAVILMVLAVTSPAGTSTSTSSQIDRFVRWRSRVWISYTVALQNLLSKGAQGILLTHPIVFTCQSNGYWWRGIAISRPILNLSAFPIHSHIDRCIADLHDRKVEIEDYLRHRNTHLHSVLLS